MKKDQIKRRFKESKGKVKEFAGRIVGNKGWNNKESMRTPPEKPKPIPMMRGKAPTRQTNMRNHSPLACILGSYPNARLCLIPQYALSSTLRSKPVRSYGDLSLWCESAYQRRNACTGRGYHRLHRTLNSV